MVIASLQAIAARTIIVDKFLMVSFQTIATFYQSNENELDYGPTWKRELLRFMKLLVWLDFDLDFMTIGRLKLRVMDQEPLEKPCEDDCGMRNPCETPVPWETWREFYVSRCRKYYPNFWLGSFLFVAGSCKYPNLLENPRKEKSIFLVWPHVGQSKDGNGIQIKPYEHYGIDHGKCLVGRGQHFRMQCFQHDPTTGEHKILFDSGEIQAPERIDVEPYVLYPYCTIRFARCTTESLLLDQIVIGSSTVDMMSWFVRAPQRRLAKEIFK